MSGRAWLPYAEIAIAFGALTALSFTLPSVRPGLVDVQPHPFWAVVVLAGVRYGTPVGLVASAIAATLGLWFALPQFVTADDLLTEPTPIVPAVLFLVGGGIIAELGEGRKRRALALERKVAELSDGLRDLAVKYLAADEARVELEKRIVGQTATVATLYEAAKSLESLHVEDLYPAILNLLVKFTHATGCAIYLHDEGALRLKVGYPETPDWERPVVAPEDHRLIVQAVTQRKVATIRDDPSGSGRGAFARQPLIMAGPLLRGDRVFGVIVVERMAFLDFNAASVKMFAILADWASGAIEAALRYRETKDRNIEDEATGAYTYAYAQKRIEEERRRAERHRLPLSVVSLHVVGYDEIPGYNVPKVLAVLGAVFRASLRNIDLVGHYREPDGFLLVLPLTPAAGAWIVCDRVVAEVRAFGFRPYTDDRLLEIVGSVTSYDPQARQWQTAVRPGPSSFAPFRAPPPVPLPHGERGNHPAERSTSPFPRREGGEGVRSTGAEEVRSGGERG